MVKKRIKILCVISLLIIAVFALFFKAFLSVFSLLAFSAMIAYLIFPLIYLFEKRMPKRLGICLGILFVCVLLFTSVMFFVPVFIAQLKNFFVSLPMYVEDLNNKINELSEKVPYVDKIINEISYDSGFNEKIMSILNSFDPSSLFKTITAVFLVPIIIYYFIAEREKIKNLCVFLLPSKIKSSTLYMFKEINRQLRDYIRSEFVIIISLSGLMAVALALFGFKYWLILGLIMGVLNIIPYIGPFLGSLPIVFTAMPDGKSRVWLAIFLIVFIQQIDNFIIQPRIISGGVKIHPAVVLVCVLFGSSIGNFAGMLLAIPAFIILRILFKEFYKNFSEINTKNSKISQI